MYELLVQIEIEIEDTYRLVNWTREIEIEDL